jgi:RimJ/RimL family protein N-acetyltransferase
MRAQTQQVIAFLRHDVLRNIVLLKMLHTYAEAIQCYYVETDSGAGVLLMLPTKVSPFDAQTYPSSEYVVLLSTTTSPMVQALLPHVPTNCPLVFKFLDLHDRVEVERQFSLKRKTAYLSFTCVPESRFSDSTEVVVSDRVDERYLDLYEEQGYQLDEVQAYFATGQALSFALYQNNLPLSTCFAYLNFEPVWEIGGVYTLPSERQKGYAGQVVETALHTLAQNKRIPRYQVHEDNHASIRLAERLGLCKFVTVEHYVYEHKIAWRK